MGENIYKKDYKLSEIEFDDAIEFENEALAALAMNRSFSFMKFVLTDDKPNANKQRVPVEEFDNLVTSGRFAPIKMAYNEIRDGHDYSLPLGVITHLKKEGDRIDGIAALWSRERPNDIRLLKSAKAEGKPINLSWEIMYSDSDLDENGIENLRGTLLRAATIVGMPAYEGRTPVLAIASNELSGILRKLEDKEDLTIIELGKLNGAIASYKEKNEDVPEVLDLVVEKIRDGKPLEDDEIAIVTTTLRDTNSSKTNKEDNALDENLEKAQAEVEELKAKLATEEARISELETELKELREFKASVDKEREDKERLEAIKAQFAEAGVEKDEDYFDTNKERLLAMDKEGLDFFVQELAAGLASKKDPEGEENEKDSKASKNKLPPMSNTDPSKLSPREIADELLKRARK